MQRLKRISALLLVCVLVGFVVLTLVCAVTGSQYFMASLVTTLLLPILLYVYMFIYRLMKRNEKEIENDNCEEK